MVKCFKWQITFCCLSLLYKRVFLICIELIFFNWLLNVAPTFSFYVSFFLSNLFGANTEVMGKNFGVVEERLLPPVAFPGDFYFRLLSFCVHRFILQFID